MATIETQLTSDASMEQRPADFRIEEGQRTNGCRIFSLLVPVGTGWNRMDSIIVTKGFNNGVHLNAPYHREFDSVEITTSEEGGREAALMEAITNFIQEKVLHR